MKGSMSTNQAIINVQLIYKDKANKLVFYFSSDDETDNLEVNLDNEMGQLELTKVFSKLLERMLTQTVQLNLTFEEGYNTVLYKDVCTEYIKAFNKELDRVYEQMQTELVAD